ncbi:MAG: hypothetical protein ACRDD7_11035 [Peptostreptococcaceae bacterium]
MDKKPKVKCKYNRRELLRKELFKDWDALNIAYKSLIMVCVLLFIIIILIAFFSNGGNGVQNSLEVVFRTTLASVFGFLLSSNIKGQTKKKNIQIEKIREELDKVQVELDKLEKSSILDGTKCELEEKYLNNDINLVQIIIALTICLMSIFVIGVLLITDNLENVPAVSQIRDLMCSSIGFLIGESSKNNE